MGDIVILIPAYNEEKSIAATVEAARGLPGVREVIVIDDGSRDRTSAWAEKAGARVVKLEKNRGKGRSLMAGIAAIDQEPFGVLFLDGDLGSSAANCGVLIEALKRGADLAIAGITSPRHSGGFGLTVGLARWGIRFFTKRYVNTPLSGQRAFTWRMLTNILPLDSGFGVEVGSTIRVLRAGGMVEEVPVRITHRYTGRNLSGFLHRGRQFASVSRALFRAMLEGRRWRK